MADGILNKIAKKASPYYGLTSAVMQDPANYARAVYEQGLGMGWGDEAEAYVRSKLKGTPYQAELDDIRKEYGAFQRAHPMGSAAAELVGGVIPAVASYAATAGTEGAAAPTTVPTTARELGTLARIAKSPVVRDALRGGITGGFYGGVAGAGRADTDRLGGAESGLASGLLFGTAIPVAFHTGKGVADWGRDRFSSARDWIEQRAAKYYADALAKSGRTPQDIQGELAAARAQGVPMTMATATPETTVLAGKVSRAGGPEVAKMEQQLVEQARGSRERVFGKTKEALGVTNRYTKTAEDLANSLRKEAEPVYEDAYNTVGSINDERINQYLQNPLIKKAYKEAEANARTDAMSAVERGENPEKYAVQPLFDEEGNLSTANNPIFVTDAEGKVHMQNPPSLRSLDRVKRYLDRVVDSKYQRGEQDAKTYENLRNGFRTAIDNATTDPVTGESIYANARGVYSSHAEVKNSLENAVTNFGKMSADQLKSEWGKMNDAQKEVFRVGALEHVYNQVMGPSSNVNAAAKLTSSPDYVAKLKTLFDGNESQYNLFSAGLQREAQLLDRTNQILGQAKSARQAGAKGGVGASDYNAVDFAKDAVRGPYSLVNSMMNMFKGAPVSDALTDRLATMLMSKNADEVRKAVQTIEEHAATAAKVQRNLSIAGTAAGTGTIAALTTPMSVKEEKNIPGPAIERSKAAMPDTTTVQPVPMPVQEEGAPSQLDEELEKAAE